MEKTQDSADKDGKIIVFGAFKAMGDLLCACPVIRSELDAGNRIHLLLFNNKALSEFVQLIDFGPNGYRLSIHFLPVPGGLRAFRMFFREMSKLDPELVWISPHAPAPASSWKIPILMWLLKKLYWRRSRLAGAKSERMSFLFDDRVQVDRGLPYSKREWDAFYALPGAGARTQPASLAFAPEIMAVRDSVPLFDLLIHPGANAENRRWPSGHYAEVVRRLPEKYKIAVVGLPGDLEKTRASLPGDRGIQFLSGSLKDLLITIASCRTLLTMDSGNVHFAKVLRVPAVALFGQQDPTRVIQIDDQVTAIYEKKFPCQPCGQKYCSQPEVYCLNSLSPETVSRAIERSLSRAAAH